MTTPNPESSGPPLRAIAMVLIALAILFAGLGAASLGGSDSDESEPVAATSSASTAPVTTTTSAAASAPRTTSAAAAPPATTTTAAGTTTKSATASAPAQVDKSVPVRVFNNSTVSGLAAQTADELTSTGWNVSETGNYSYGLIQVTTVYYRTGNASEKQAAESIAAELGVKAEPRFEGITSASPGVIVIVTSE
ncbi:LytR C-terminal domain-containing protein [Rhodococcus sp. SGAir0479]|uniref:LytR C-terminal domain-containing protein n=1 Tax=Rhodococcus sp. SGAir0479 TaxID=2567884 RepID=UPI0010CD301D|nr:LytR C-terminal domain-containing protein [Rhodococcus sp. SGAir0479]QCQ92427.1 LytR family transcriptional regulator [Rhodococcus sp. SGAir0479]